MHSWFFVLRRGHAYWFLERGEGMKKERERNINVPLAHTPTGDPTHDIGMCSNWESNPWPLVLPDDAQPTEPPRPGLHSWFLKNSLQISPGREWKGYILEPYRKHHSNETKSISFEIENKNHHPYFYLLL